MSEQAKPMSDEGLARLRGSDFGAVLMPLELQALLARLDQAEAKVKAVDDAFVEADKEKYDELKWQAFMDALDK